MLVIGHFSLLELWIKICLRTSGNYSTFLYTASIGDSSSLNLNVPRFSDLILDLVLLRSKILLIVTSAPKSVPEIAYERHDLTATGLDKQVSRDRELCVLHQP